MSAKRMPRVAIAIDCNPLDIVNGMGLIVAATLDCAKSLLGRYEFALIINSNSAIDVQSICNRWRYLTDVRTSIESLADYDAIIAFATSWSPLSRKLLRSSVRPVLLHCNDSLAFYNACQFPRRIVATLYAVAREVSVLWPRNCRTVVACGDGDRKWLAVLAPGKRVICLPNGVDVARFPYREKGQIDGPIRLVFAGVLNYEPNVRAVVGVIQNILPQLSIDYHFTVVGRDPTQELRSVCRGNKKVTLTGYVPDLVPYYHHSHVSVCPIAIRTGVKNKILESIATGTPVVTFDKTLSNFAKGLPGVVCGDTWLELAKAVEQIPGRWQQTLVDVSTGAQLIRREWTWDARTVRLMNEVSRMITTSDR